jgi:NAD-dependent dihydropyrimidine dehydrogenase PreA subunit
MAGMFIDVVVEPKAAADPALARKLEEVCPVDIFAVAEDGTVRVVQENLDECTLCDLCIEASPPGAVRVVKLYAA